MTRNQLPEGVGKKIVEALKRQAEADITPLEENNNVITNTLPLTEIEDLPEVQYTQLAEDENTSDNDMIVEEDIPAMPLGVYQPKEENPVYEKPAVQEIPAEKTVVTTPKTQAFSFDEPSLRKEKVQKFSPNVSISIPSNVAVLKNLISTLPVGVTKQTGAQIIRQTLEAMGLPMNSVLKEAQDVQEELNSSTRECMLKIQEYKTNILQLEQSVQEYQKNITQINDLVSLFLLTDKN